MQNRKIYIEHCINHTQVLVPFNISVNPPLNLDLRVNQRLTRITSWLLGHKERHKMLCYFMSRLFAVHFIISKNTSA